MSDDVLVLSEIDKELLELAALKVPWYMVCGDFHRRYGSAGGLAKRLFELSDAGLVSIQEKTPGDVLASPEALEIDALENNCYEDFDSSRGARWEIIATDRGFAAVEEDLGKQ